MDRDTHSGSSPERSLSKVLRGRRRKQTDNASAPPSVAPNENLNVERSGLLRSSLDRNFDRFRDRSSRSGSAEPEASNGKDQDTASHGRKLSKVLAKTSRRRRKKTLEQDGGEDGDIPGLFLTATDGSNKTVDALTLEPNNDSSDSLPQRGKSVASSLLTEGSEPDNPTTRPTLDSRPSQVGYLTLSSPLIAAEAVNVSGSSATELATLASNPPSSFIPQTSTTSIPGPPRQPPTVVTSDVHVSGLAGASAGQSIGAAVEQGGADTSYIVARKPLPPTKINVTPPARSESPNQAETPATLVTPPTPDQPQAPLTPLGTARSDSVPSLLPSFGHRRVKSATAGPSKLSVSNAPPLTPALEEVETPGGAVADPASGSAPIGSGGFFSSLFSSTQNAVNQISNTFTAAPGKERTRSAPASRDGENVGPTGDEEVILPNPTGDGSAIPEVAVEEEPAVKTLGSGDLRLSHLGISELSSDASMNSKEELPEFLQSPAVIQDTTTVNGTHETSNVESATAAYVPEKAVELPAVTKTDRESIATRPKSISSAIGSLPGDATPPRSIVNGAEGSIDRRSGSVRSRISDRTRRRRRKNSNHSGSAPGAIAAALAASHSALANPAAKSSRLTTYPAANPKRNKDFHQLFKSVPEDDCLLEDYSAALQREILLHGRLYISERHICFSSNIIGYVTTLVVSFDEVVALEKKNTAMIFPNAIVIQTLHAKNVFASLINRDSTYDLILNIWKAGHPNLRPTEGGFVLDNSVVSEKPDHADSIEEEEEEEETDEDDEDFDDDDDENAVVSNGGGEGSIVGSDGGDPSKVVNQRVVSSAAGPGPAANGSATKGVGVSEVVTALDGFPGPITHIPTECGDSDSHYDKLCLDDIIPAPLGKVYSLMFGPLSGGFMRKFLEDQESGDIQYEDDKKGMDDSAKSYSYSFIKKLPGGIGPKQTRCNVDQVLEVFDLEKAVSVTCVAATPDVPSGSSFLTKTKYCLMWAPNNSTRIIMTSTTEWSAKSFLRGAIDKGAEAGQIKYGKDLSAFLKAQLVSKSPSKGSRAKAKGRKKKTSGSPGLPASIHNETSRSASSRSQGGALEFLAPIREVLGPAGDILGPFLSTTTVLGVLLFCVTILWLRQSYGSSKQPALDLPSLLTPQRVAAYEQLWKREETELWNWLEDRINLDGLASPGGDEQAKKMQTIRARDIGSRLDEDKMSHRQIDDAIRVTEERLQALRAVIERTKSKGEKSTSQT